MFRFAPAPAAAAAAARRCRRKLPTRPSAGRPGDQGAGNKCIIDHKAPVAALAISPDDSLLVSSRCEHDSPRPLSAAEPLGPNTPA
jgi:hypothetical protein